ncbi:MAG: trypsin-like peptidase domain-containing protein, partial [Armatimonadota bacterium]
DEFQSTPGEVLSLIRGTQVHEEMQLVRRTDPQTGEETVTVTGTTAGPLGRFQHSAATGHGSSGGPVLDGRGRVVGVAYALLAQRMPTPENDSSSGELNLAIASNVLKRFLSYNAIPFTEAEK